MKKTSQLLLLFIFISCSDSVKDSSNLPGRLGNPEMNLKNDSRAIPAVTKVMSQYGLGAFAPDPPISIEATLRRNISILVFRASRC